MFVYLRVKHQHLCPQQITTYLDTPDTELHKGTKHLSASDLVSCSTDSAFDKQTVIMRLMNENKQIMFRQSNTIYARP